MRAILPPSKLLPATIVSISVTIVLKVAVMFVWLSGIGVSRAETLQPPTMKEDYSVANATSSDPTRAPPAVRGEPPRTDETSAATTDIKLRRSPIEEREMRVNQREATLAAANQRLAARVAELTALQSNLQALEKKQKEHDEANWTALVKMYEGMRPHDAATIFNALDKPVLLEILDRMKPAKAAPVIAYMEAEKARQMTTELANRRTRSTSATN